MLWLAHRWYLEQSKKNIPTFRHLQLSCIIAHSVVTEYCIQLRICKGLNRSYFDLTKVTQNIDCADRVSSMSVLEKKSDYVIGT